MAPTVCTACGRQTGLRFVMVKKVFHFFWIPLVPAGSSVVMQCSSCNTEWKVPNTPSDHTFWAYFVLSLGFLLGGLAYGWRNPILNMLLYFWPPAIIISLIYIMTLPSKFRGFPHAASPGPSYQVPQARNCPKCGMTFSAHTGVCPYCLNRSY